MHCGDHTCEYGPRLIVDATGRSAAFARLQGSSIEALDSQVGLITFRASNPAVDSNSRRGGDRIVRARLVVLYPVA